MSLPVHPRRARPRALPEAVLLRPTRTRVLVPALVVALVGGLTGGVLGGPGAGTPSAEAAPLWPVPQPYRVQADPPVRLATLPQGSEYVALGDSYSAGYGLPVPTHLPSNACGQSAEDWPHQVAARFGLALTDVSCAGATSADVTRRSQYRGTPPQVQALSADTRLVTLTIGGNDADLFGTASSCLALSASGPVFSGKNAPSCQHSLEEDGVDRLGDRIRSRVALGIADTLAAIRTAAPDAVIVLVGYPAIFPDAVHTPARGCFRPAVDLGTLTGSFPRDTYPFTDDDVRYLHGVQEQLDTVGQAAARAADVTFVDVFAGSQAHSPCARSGAWITGVSLDSGSGLQRIDLEPGALHPNSAGTRWLAHRTEDAIRSLAG